MFHTIPHAPPHFPSSTESHVLWDAPSLSHFPSPHQRFLGLLPTQNTGIRMLVSGIFSEGTQTKTISLPI